jgi:hypothetical protein
VAIESTNFRDSQRGCLTSPPSDSPAPIIFTISVWSVPAKARSRVPSPRLQWARGRRCHRRQRRACPFAPLSLSLHSTLGGDHVERKLGSSLACSPTLASRRRGCVQQPSASLAAWAVPVAPLTALLAMDCSVQPPTAFYWPRGPAGAGVAPVSRRPRRPDLSLEGALPQQHSRLQFAVCKASGNAHSTFVGVRCNAASSGLSCSASYWGVWSRLGACLATPLDLSWQACCRRQPPPAGCYGGRYGSATNRAVQRATARRARCRTPAAVQHQPEMRHRHPSTQALASGGYPLSAATETRPESPCQSCEPSAEQSCTRNVHVVCLVVLSDGVYMGFPREPCVYPGSKDVG